MEIDDIEVVGDERVGHGGYLLLRRMRMRMLLSDGSRTPVGTWDYVERPSGLDAVVIALWRRGEGGRVEVLLRSGLRVPVRFGRPHEPPREHFPELVAGILEPGDEPRRRAADEALEEAGLRRHLDRCERCHALGVAIGGFTAALRAAPALGADEPFVAVAARSGSRAPRLRSRSGVPSCRPRSGGRPPAPSRLHPVSS